MSRRTLRLAAAGLAALSLAAVAACGGDDERTAPAVGEPVTDQPADHGDHGDHGDAPTIEVRALDFSFEDLPDTVAPGTRFTLVNDAPSELHELVAIALTPTETRSADELVHLPEAELGQLMAAGPPAFVILTPPGGDPIPAVGDGTLTEPGRYLLMCAIPTGVDPGAYLEAAAAAGGEKPDVPGGPPHFVHGMFAEITVE